MIAVLQTGTAPVRNAFGALLLVVAWTFFTAEMILVRLVSETYSVAQIGVFRQGVQALLLLPVILWTGGALLSTRRFPMHVGRAACSAGGMVLFYLAFILLPFALATTLTFMNGIFLMILAWLLLGERIGPRRIGAVAAGFAGVLVVMRPGISTVDPGMIVALFAAFVAAMLMIVTRTLSATEGRMTIMAFSAWLGLGFLAVPALLSWVPVEGRHMGLLLLVGLVGTAGQFLMVGAFQVAEASALAPVDYVRLIFAVAAGYLLFDEIPDFWTWAGAAIIIAAVAYATHRERAAARLERSPT